MKESDREKVELLFEAGRTLDNARAFLVEHHCENQAWMDEELRSLWRFSGEEEPSFPFETTVTFMSRAKGALDSKPESLPKTDNAYRIVSTIASGGMGTVYKAEQEKPIKRMVALKILQTTLSTEEHLSRFQFEQRAMALMNHPNIASVYDSGITADGLPFYTMEYLNALPIHHYCDQHQLTIEARIRLLMKVCDGLQHAHRKGVIHRDIKPSNVLVTDQDDQVVPKIIDFGIAKLVDHAQMEEPLQTKVGIVMGTPVYMSPEQAGGHSEYIDTRTDIYSLGVLLYELMVGVTPLEAQLKKARSMKESCRIIQEEECQAPSARVEITSERFARIAASRATDPATLKRTIHNDIDWVIMKALAKSPADRYGSCSELSDDLGRYLADMPVLACPPGKLYYLKKFMRRYRRGVITTAITLLSLLIAITFGVVREAQSRRHIREEADKARAVSQIFTSMIRAADPDDAGPEAKMIDLLEVASQNVSKDFAQEPEIEAFVHNHLGNAFYALGINDKARPHFDKAFEIHRNLFGPDHPDTLETACNIARLLRDTGTYAQSEQRYQDTVRRQIHVLGPDDVNTLNTQAQMAHLYFLQGRYQEAETLFRETLTRQLAVMGEENSATQATKSGLAQVLAKEGEVEETRTLYQEAVQGLRRLLGDEDSQTLAALNNFTNFLMSQGQYTDAEELYREVLEIRSRRPGSRSRILFSKNGLGCALYGQGRYEEAEPLLREAYEGWQATLGTHSVHTLNALNNLARVVAALGRTEEAVDLLKMVASIKEPALVRNPEVLQAKHTLGDKLLTLDRLAEAESVLKETLQLKSQVFGETDPTTLRTMATLAQTLQRQGHLEEAMTYYDRALRIAREKLGDNHRDTALYRDLQSTCRVQIEKKAELQ